MPRSVLLGRPWPQPGEPLFTEDDTRLALELQAEEDQRCPSGHPLDEAVGDEGPAINVESFVCEMCAAVQAAQRTAGKQQQDAGEAGEDLLDGRHWFAVLDHH